MVEMYQEDVEGIEIIHAVPSGQYQQSLPTIFFNHGFLSSKEIYSYFGYSLAKAGFRVILPDALLHGARADGNEPQRLGSFWRILQNNVDEIAVLKQAFVSRGLANPERLGVGGVSMGGMTTLASLVRFPWVKVAASLMGSGYFSALCEALYPAYSQDNAAEREAFKRHHAPLLSWDLSDKVAQVAGRPLFIWHGEQDDVVPFADSLRLRQEIIASGHEANLTFVAEPEASHKVTVNALAHTTAFFAKHL